MELPDCSYDYRHERIRPIRKFRCENCGCWIYQGDTYYEVKAKEYCEECMEDMKKYAEDDE